MGYYINDITSFSNIGFDKIDFDFINSSVSQEIENPDSKHLQGKGLRFVPRTVRIIHNIVGEMLEKNNLRIEKENLGIYNTNDICALEASIDFDQEIEDFGVKLANPMKIPYTLNGATAGWLAIRNKMNNVNLTVNAGRCGMISALNLAGLDFMDKETNQTILLGAHFMGEMYRKYNQNTTFNKEIAVGMLASVEKTETSLIEILECRTMTYDKEYLETLLNEGLGNNFVESDDYINLENSRGFMFFQSTSAQLSCFPFFINNIKTFIKEATEEEYKYIIVDKRGLMGYVIFKLAKS